MRMYINVLKLYTQKYFYVWTKKKFATDVLLGEKYQIFTFVVDKTEGRNETKREYYFFLYFDISRVSSAFVAGDKW